MLCASVASRTPALALTVILLRLSHQQDAKTSLPVVPYTHSCLAGIIGGLYKVKKQCNPPLCVSTVYVCVCVFVFVISPRKEAEPSRAQPT